MLTGPMTARRSNAKTAYGLMSDIVAYILEEPKRLWMGDWMIRDMDYIKQDLEMDLDDLFMSTGVDAKYGTKKYARIVAKRIEKFQREHREALRAVKIKKPGPKGNGR